MMLEMLPIALLILSAVVALDFARDIYSDKRSLFDRRFQATVSFIVFAGAVFRFLTDATLWIMRSTTSW